MNTVYVGGGFNGAVRSDMSEGLQRRLAAEEAAEAREQARLERERREAAEWCTRLLQVAERGCQPRI
jgi:hypothetical protein